MNKAFHISSVYKKLLVIYLETHTQMICLTNNGNWYSHLRTVFSTCGKFLEKEDQIKMNCIAIQTRSGLVICTYV